MTEPTEPRMQIAAEDIKLVKEDIDKLNPTKTAQELTTIVVSLQQLVGGLRSVSRDDQTRADKVESSVNKIIKTIAFFSDRASQILKMHDEMLRRTQQQTTATEEELRRIKETIKKLIDDFREEADYILGFKKYEVIDSKLLERINNQYINLKDTLTFIMKDHSKVMSLGDKQKKKELKRYREMLHTNLDPIIKELETIQRSVGRRERRAERQEINKVKDVIKLKQELNEQLNAFLQSYSSQGKEPLHVDDILTIKSKLEALTIEQQQVIRTRLATEEDLFKHVGQLEALLKHFSDLVKATEDSFSPLQEWIQGNDSIVSGHIAHITTDITHKINELRKEDSEIKSALTVLQELDQLLKKFQIKME